MQPLSHKTRIKLVTLLWIVFLVGTPLLILCSTGYRLDDALSLVRTGGIFIHSNLSDTRVYVNDDFVEDNGLVLRNTFIQNLWPNKIYHVRVEKDGYHTWEKDFRVTPNIVMEAQVLMLPTQIEVRDIEEFTVLDIATTTRDESELNPEYAQMAELFEEQLAQFEVEVSTTTRRTVAGVVRLVTSTSTEVELPNYIERLEIDGIEKMHLLREKQRMVAWLDNGEVRVVWAGDESSVPYIFCGVDACAEELMVDAAEYINYYDFLPGRNDVLIILTQTGVYAIEIDGRSRPNMQPIYLGRGLDFRVENNNTIFVKDGEVFKEVEI